MIEHDLYIVVKKDGTPGQWYMDENIISSLILMLDNAIGESRKAKEEVFIHMLGLSKCPMTILNNLYRMGYNVAMTKLKNEMRVRDIRYRMTPDQVYYIQVKTGYKSYVTLQCIESVIGLRNIPQTRKEAQEALKLYHYTRDSFLSGKKRSANRILYSAASISRTLFNASNNDFSRAATKTASVMINGHHYSRGQIVEKFCRPGVRGALCYVSEKGYSYRGPGIVLDANSLYDYIAIAYSMPSPHLIACGSGIPKRRFLNRALYYMIIKVEVSATLKPDGIACISADATRGNDYLPTMNKRILTLTPYDRDLLFDNYIISYYRIKSYMVWTNGSKEMRKYILPLYEKKRTLPKGIERDYVKSCLTGFIGTFARKVQKMDYNVTLDENDNILYGHRDPVTAEEYFSRLKKTEGLCHINMAIVSGARHYIIQFIKRHPDRFLYCDTDSLHLSGTDIPGDIPISDKLGDFKVEQVFDGCIYHGQKSYVHSVDGVVIPTISGIPKDTHFDTMEDVYTKPFNIKLITEDIYTGDIYYKAERRSFTPKVEKTIEEKRQEKSLEWYDTNVVIPKMMEEHRIDGFIAMWNKLVDEGHPHDFDSAIKYIRQAYIY